VNIKDLKIEIERQRGHLRGKPSKLVWSAPNGPVGMELIDAFFAGIESLEKRVAALEKHG
jgi:hypothetical protein